MILQLWSAADNKKRERAAQIEHLIFVFIFLELSHYRAQLVLIVSSCEELPLFLCAALWDSIAHQQRTQK